MRTLFAGKIWLSYSQMDLRGAGDETSAEYELMFLGQSNGLCGAAIDGFACLKTGTETGDIDLRVELHDTEPTTASYWQEVIEVTFRPRVRPVTLIGLMGNCAVSLDLACVDYRVRYCASGMDEGHCTPTQREPVAERYLLQFWPAPPARDCVLRETSATAAHAHRWARSLVHRSVPPRSAAIGTERAKLAVVLGMFAPGLLDPIAAADAEKQRSIARRVVHRACELAGVASIDWIAPALAAMDRGQPLPDPFDDKTAVTARLIDDARISKTPNHWVVDDGHTQSQQELALHTVLEAVQADPLRAAIDAVAVAMLSCRDLEQMTAEVRSWLIE